MPEYTSRAEFHAKAAKPEPAACFFHAAPGTCSERVCRTIHFFQNGEMLVATFFIIIYHLKQSLWQRAYAHSLFFPEAHPLYEAED